jgi:uroporphyrinogen decarboxylase
MVEGGSSKHFAIIKAMMYNEPAMLNTLLAKVAQASTLYLQAQVKAGAKALMIFDTWGGILTPNTYRQFSLHYMQEIVTSLKSDATTKDIPVILFTKQGGQWLEELAATGADALQVDWTMNLSVARAKVGNQVALQGNLDPAMLYASPERIQQEVKNILADFGQGSGHVFNLGHGIYPDIPPEHAQAMVEAVRAYSPQYHR